MVDRTKSEGLDSFTGIVDSVNLEQSDNGPQYKITMNTDISKSGKMYEWVNIPEKATETTVPEGSNIDKYLQEIEIAIPKAKDAPTVEEALKVMVGKNIRFVRKKLGKSFTGEDGVTHDAKNFWVPHSVVD